MEESLKKEVEILMEHCDKFRKVINDYMRIRGEDIHALITRYNYNNLLSLNDVRFLTFRETPIESENSITYEKLPFVVMSRDAWDRKRQKELSEAMKICLESGKKIPKEWLDEYNEISDRYKESEE